MTIQECYKQLGGDFAQVEKRLSSTDLVKKFVAMFLEDGSFSELCAAMEERQFERAFRAAHTLMEVCANLSLTGLHSYASQLTEFLHTAPETIPPGAEFLLKITEQEYALTISTIRAYIDSEQVCRLSDLRTRYRPAV